VGLFGHKKESEQKIDNNPDYYCWSCKQFYNHSNVEWKVRSISLPLGDEKEDNPLTTKHLGMDLGESSPNEIFNCSEYEYVGNCPNCKANINCLWFGKKSLENSFKNKLEPIGQDVICVNCKTPNERLYAIWFSYRVKDAETNEIVEYLSAVCKGCNRVLYYPLESFDLSKGIIK